jgi:hypothetical protein
MLSVNETFSNPSPFLELLILWRLRFTNCWRLGRTRNVRKSSRNIMSVKTTVSRVSSQSRLLSLNWCSLLAIIAVAPFATRQSIHALKRIVTAQAMVLIGG